MGIMFTILQAIAEFVEIDERIRICLDLNSSSLEITQTTDRRSNLFMSHSLSFVSDIVDAPVKEP
ncbi:hypothetical protein OUZ56_014711 [Daphnia magna]|uniref:Uncharacterized protein n=1 Tax=Daphnia magna TaxID=35525 RepID=A0ABR0AKN2_9CRUS|nr:hypothetical protein OUZ56_014711 [Daphnia magna]